MHNGRPVRVTIWAVFSPLMFVYRIFMSPRPGVFEIYASSLVKVDRVKEALPPDVLLAASWRRVSRMRVGGEDAERVHGCSLAKDRLEKGAGFLDE